MGSHSMFAEDSSLQGWGRKLRLIAPAIEEKAKEDRARAEAGAATTEAISKLAAQGESDLPASKALTAELESIAAEMKKLDAEAAAIAEKRGRLAAQAEVLPAKYRSEHEMDEDRLDGVRGSREREKRADVTNAERDT